jgi:hypothetical protein
MWDRANKDTGKRTAIKTQGGGRGLTNRNKPINPPQRWVSQIKPKVDLLLIEYEQDFNKPTQGPVVTACEYQRKCCHAGKS